MIQQYFIFFFFGERPKWLMWTILVLWIFVIQKIDEKDIVIIKNKEMVKR